MGGVGGTEDGLSNTRSSNKKGNGYKEKDEEKHGDKEGTMGAGAVRFQRTRMTGQTLGGNVQKQLDIQALAGGSWAPLYFCDTKGVTIA